VRARNQERFLREDGVIMVATIAFGMGIDKPDVRFVVHLDLPKTMEGYYQETGRAARDGEPAETLLLYGLQDLVRIRQMVDESESDEARKRVERAKLDALLGWCEITSCRRAALLDYFGEPDTEPCGNCDVCLTPPDTWNATIPAQKLISCVLRTGQRFGGAHVIDVLLGKETDKIRQHQHTELSTYGIGEELDERGWRSVLRQLVARGYLSADPDRFNALKVEGPSRALLRSEEVLTLRKDPTPSRAARRSRSASAGASAASLSPVEAMLFEELRACRRRLADEQGVPPYVVFHDATLAEMAARRPQTLAAMLEISGVGDGKLARYGDAFLDVLLGGDGSASEQEAGLDADVDEHAVAEGRVTQLDGGAEDEVDADEDDGAEDEFVPDSSYRSLSDDP